MQQNSSKLTTYLTIGISIGFIVLLGLIYKIELDSSNIPTNSKKTTTTADYFIDDQQQQSFKHLLNDTLDDCQCPSSLYSTENIALIKHGENSPVFVPESLSPMLPDILDKIYENKLDDGILVTVAGYAIKNEVYNWIELLKEAEEEKFIIFCTDMNLYTLLIVTGHEDKAVLIPDDWFINDLELFRNTTTNLLDNTVPRLSHIKTWILQRLAYTKGINNVLMLDINQIMLHARTREYIQTLLHIRWDTQLIATQDDLNQHVINTGLMMIRSDAAQVKRLIANTIQIQEEYTHLNQQEALNKAMEQLDLNVKSGMIVLLDIIHFPNGVNYFDKDLSGSRGIEPYIIHANHKVRYISNFYISLLNVFYF